jgi:hypothetical protein
MQRNKDGVTAFLKKAIRQVRKFTQILKEKHHPVKTLKKNPKVNRHFKA